MTLTVSMLVSSACHEGHSASGSHASGAACSDAGAADCDVAASAPAAGQSGSTATAASPRAGRAGHSSGAGAEAGRAGKAASGSPQAGRAGAHEEPRDAGTRDAASERMDADVSAHEDSGADDDAGATEPGGVYACHGGQPYGNSCSDPLIDSAFQGGDYVWMLALSGDDLSTSSIGFDREHIACSGSWSGDSFSCSAEWTRAGRVCNNTLHVQRASDGMLTFWIGPSDREVAYCQR